MIPIKIILLTSLSNGKVMDKQFLSVLLAFSPPTLSSHSSYSSVAELFSIFSLNIGSHLYLDLTHSGRTYFSLSWKAIFKLSHSIPAQSLDYASSILQLKSFKLGLYLSVYISLSSIQSLDIFLFSKN